MVGKSSLSQEELDNMTKTKIWRILYSPPHPTLFAEGNSLVRELSDQEERKSFITQLDDWFYPKVGK